jgi:ferredoxin
MTHKLGTWREQFDASGCVGCGRCITWCPVGIDITEEAADLRSSDASRTRRAGRRGDRDTAQGGQA